MSSLHNAHLWNNPNGKQPIGHDCLVALRHFVIRWLVGYVALATSFLMPKRSHDDEVSLEEHYEPAFFTIFATAALPTPDDTAA